MAPGVRAGPWTIEHELGRGGMGTVYAVVHDDIGKRAALKVVHKRLLARGFNADRLFFEAKVVNQIAHPNIVDIFETGRLADGRPYLVMERLDGYTLAEYAERAKILPDQAIEILLQICNAVSAAHAAGVIHRDLKLDNVFLVDNSQHPGAPTIKLLDWGIAKVINPTSTRHTIEGQLVGTPRYLSPEQAAGAAVTVKTDVYSLGVMAYELFLEALPFEATTAAEVMMMHMRATPAPPSELWPCIPAQLEVLLLSMLAKLPAHRPSMEEVIDRLEQVRRELAHRRSVPQRLLTSWSAPRRRTTMQSAVAILGTIPPAFATQNGRWRYAAGALALAASAAVFAFTRAGSPQAAAASISSDRMPVADREPMPAFDGDVRGTTPAFDAATTTATSITNTRQPTAAPRKRASARIDRAERPMSSRRAPVRNPAMSKVPVVPHRASALDPDGLIDSYR
ncbi:MAG: serine/threonine protein kinase [Kofleriaceae bacterium]